MSINKNLKKDKKKYYVVCDNDEACKSNMTYSFYRAVKTTPCDSLTNFPNSLHNVSSADDSLNQNVPIDITHSLQISASNRSVDAVYSKNIDKVLEILPESAEFRYEQDNNGKDQLRITKWLTAKEIYSYKFFEVLYGHHFEEKKKNGKFFSMKLSVVKI